MLVTPAYLVIACGYVVVTSVYVIATTTSGYFFLLLITFGSLFDNYVCSLFTTFFMVTFCLQFFYDLTNLRVVQRFVSTKKYIARQNYVSQKKKNFVGTKTKYVTPKREGQAD